MKTDYGTCISELKSIVAEFVNERNWHDYHVPRNLAKSIIIEAAELLELFQWEDTENNKDIQDELADIMIYILSLSNVSNIDISQSVIQKMEKNKKRKWKYG